MLTCDSKKACIMVHTTFKIQALHDRTCVLHVRAQRYNPDKHNDNIYDKWIWGMRISHTCATIHKHASAVYGRTNAIFIHLANMLNPKCHKLEATLFYMFANNVQNVVIGMHLNYELMRVMCVLYLLYIPIVVSEIYVHRLFYKLRLNLCSAVVHLVLMVCVGNFYYQSNGCI